MGRSSRFGACATIAELSTECIRGVAPVKLSPGHPGGAPGLRVERMERVDSAREAREVRHGCHAAPMAGERQSVGGAEES